MHLTPKLKHLQKLVGSILVLSENKDTVERTRDAGHYTEAGKANAEGLLKSLQLTMPMVLRDIEHAVHDLLDLEMSRCLVLSTAHVRPLTMDHLKCDMDTRHAMGWPAMTVAAYEHGVFLTVPPYQMRLYAKMPDDLADVLAYASGHGAQLLRLESGGREMGDLKTYEWE